MRNVIDVMCNLAKKKKKKTEKKDLHGDDLCVRLLLNASFFKARGILLF